MWLSLFKNKKGPWFALKLKQDPTQYKNKSDELRDICTCSNVCTKFNPIASKSVPVIRALGRMPEIAARDAHSLDHSTNNLYGALSRNMSIKNLRMCVAQLILGSHSRYFPHSLNKTSSLDIAERSSRDLVIPIEIFNGDHQISTRSLSSQIQGGTFLAPTPTGRACLVFG